MIVTTVYRLEVALAKADPAKVSQLIPIAGSKHELLGDQLNIISRDTQDDPDRDYISEYIGALRSQLDALKALDIHVNDMCLFILYEYDSQCNLEYNPEQLKSLGDLGLTLCISCWQS